MKLSQWSVAVDHLTLESKGTTMKINIHTPHFHVISWFLNLLLCCGALAQAKDDDDRHDSRTRGPSSLARRMAVLEELVSAQSKQIATLKRALNAETQARVEGQMEMFAAASNYTDLQITTEANVRQAADTSLQAQIDRIQPQFSATEVPTLRGLASVVNVAPSRIIISSSVGVEGNLAVMDRHLLLVNRILPVGSNWIGNPNGITVFEGNAGVSTTKSLLLSRIEPIDAGIFPRNGCELKIGDGLINGCLAGNCGGCSGSGLPTVFLSPVLFGK